MSLLSWNCRGLGNPATVRVLVDLVHSKKPEIIFIIETLVGNSKLQPIKNKLGFEGLFVVDNVGRSGGLALFWKEGTEVNIRGYSRYLIDAEVRLEGGKDIWRFTGYYGCPERSRRAESWAFLKHLASLSSLPWVVMGDFNDILAQEEKKGGKPQPNWLIQGFTDAVISSGPRDLHFEGCQFTWEKSRGTPNWIAEKLDRILVSESWLDLFEGAKGLSIEASQSDHLPLILQVEVTKKFTVKSKFKFENMWLQEHQCREVVIQSWSNSHGYDLLTRIACCGIDVWKWGKGLTKGFQNKINYWKKQMEKTRERRDQTGIILFDKAQRNYLITLEQQNTYWKQRAKEFWLRGGDTNSRYFHNSVKRRRRNNRIARLKDSSGIWVEKGRALDELMMNYFKELFKSSKGDMGSVTQCIEEKISSAQNVRLTRSFEKD